MKKLKNVDFEDIEKKIIENAINAGMSVIVKSIEMII